MCTNIRLACKTFGKNQSNFVEKSIQFFGVMENSNKDISTVINLTKFKYSKYFENIKNDKVYRNMIKTCVPLNVPF